MTDPDTPPVVDDRRDGPLADLQIVLMQVEVAGILGVLVGAFIVQFVGRELPCPLCLLQRMAMMLAAMGPLYLLGRVYAGRSVEPTAFATAYGMSVIGAALGLLISSRQVLLHILPNDPGYGSAIMGMHLYTWADVVFLVVIVVSGLTMILSGSLRVSARKGPAPWTVRATQVAFLVVVAANVVSTLVESGFNAFLPDNPTEYRLIDRGPDGDQKDS